MELALVLPVLLLMVLGLIEVSVFISNYLDVLDLTREAARFASQRDPDPTKFKGTPNCSDPAAYDFYYNTACIFAPPVPAGATCAAAANPAFCGGLNPYFAINPATDDVIVTIFTVPMDTNTNTHDPVTVQPGAPWALSDHDADATHNANWKRGCGAAQVRTEPFYTQAKVQAIVNNNTLPNRGYVAVEAFYCHYQVLGIPIISNYIANPIQTHAYTIMPLPDGQPTPTPEPTPTNAP